MRLNLLLIENETTNRPGVNALLALMCFHASRFDARTNEHGEAILYDDQDRAFVESGTHRNRSAIPESRSNRQHHTQSITWKQVLLSGHTRKERQRGKNGRTFYRSIIIC